MDTTGIPELLMQRLHFRQEALPKPKSQQHSVRDMLQHSSGLGLTTKP